VSVFNDYKNIGELLQLKQKMISLSGAGKLGKNDVSLGPGGRNLATPAMPPDQKVTKPE
jgi:hypothetical protein